MEIVILILVVAAFVGYCFNLSYLFKSKNFGGREALRIIGVFIPLLGVVLGFISDDKKESE